MRARRPHNSAYAFNRFPGRKKAFAFRTFLHACFLILAANVAHAQHRIEGQVRDKATGEVLSGATVQIDRTFQGTITNEIGRFVIGVTDFPVTLVTRFIGYRSVSEVYSGPPAAPILIELEPAVIHLPEITISGEDPAVNIMRRVIERKAEWQSFLQTYKVDAYNRFRLENDSGIVSIWESGTIAFWDRKRGIREVGIWQRHTDNIEIDGVLPAALLMQNLYGDDIDVAGHRFMGVTHPDALDYYSFRLVGTRSIDDRLVYDIEVEPRSDLASGFVGRLSVLDEEFALLDVDLIPGEAFYFPMPIDRLTIRYRQQFSNFGSDVWLPADLRSSISLDLSFQGLLLIPTIRIEQISRLSNFELNVSVPDSLYAQDRAVVVDTTARRSDESVDLDVIAVPLTPREVEAYEKIDTTMTLAKAYRPTGPLSRFVKIVINTGDDGEDRSATGRRGLQKLNLTIKPSLWVNKVEGLHAGATLTLRPRKILRIQGLFGYQSKRKEWTYGGRVRLGRVAWLEAGYTDRIAPRYDSFVNNRLINSLNVLFSQSDYYDYLDEVRKYVMAGIAVPGVVGLELNVSVEDLDHRNVSNSISRGLIGRKSSFRANAKIDEGSLRLASAAIRYTGDSIPRGIGPEYSILATFEKSISGSIHDRGAYSRFGVSIVWRIATFFRRRLLPNTLDFKISAGTSTGLLPRQRYGIVEASTLFTAFGGLKTLRDHPYEGTRYVAFFWEHSFRTILFERLGWMGPVRSGINLILFGGHGRTWLSDDGLEESGSIVPTSKQFHHEIGVAISGIFGLARLDFARRLDRSDYAVGISVARIF